MLFPLEIIDYILAFLYNDRRALAACSLVSSSWVDFSRRRLFYTLVYVRGKWDVPIYPSLLLFLQSSPSVAEHVHVLDLEGGCSRLYSYRGNLDPSTFAALLALLPNLEEVKIDVVFLFPSPQYRSLPKQCSSKVLLRPLKRLYFGNIIVEDDDPCATLRQFLYPISSIETMEISQLSSACDEETLSEIRDRCRTLDIPPNLGIRTLKVNVGSTTAGWILLEAIRAANPQTLRTLEYSYYVDKEGDKFEEMQDFLQGVAGSLENLTISLTGVHIRSPNLSRCTSLQNLKINHDIPLRSKGNIPFCMNATLDALESMPHLPFKLTFELGYFYLGDVSDMIRALSMLDWARLGRTVAWHPCRVNKLTIVCRGSTTYTGFEDVFRLLREKLRELDSRGLLEISQHFT